MRLETKSLTLALALTLLSGVASVQAQQSSAPAAPAACALTLDLPAVHPAPAPVELTATASQELGDSLSASVESGSGLIVVSIKAGSEPNSAQITFDASKATAGDWDLSLWGTQGTCTTKVSVKTD